MKDFGLEHALSFTSSAQGVIFLFCCLKKICLELLDICWAPLPYMCAEKYLLVLMGGLLKGQASADPGARASSAAVEIYRVNLELSKY